MSDATFLIQLSSIDVDQRLRAVDARAVESLASSMKESGQITPIELLASGNGRYTLVSGAHRFDAARLLGWPSIKAVLFEGTIDQARMREIDENLYRRELSPFDQAEFVAERRIIWERLYGNVRRGGDRRSKVQVVSLVEQMRQAGFIKETSARFNLHPKTVKRALSRKAHIDPKVWLAIRGTPAAESGALLDKLRKLDTETQRAVIDLAQSRGCAIDVAFSTLKRAEMPPPEFPLLALVQRGWTKASEAERRRIRDFIKQTNQETES